MRKKSIMLVVDALIAVFLLAIDQFIKYLAVSRLKGSAPLVLIDGILELQYVENRGSAFGILQGQKVFLLLVGVLFVAVLLFVLVKLPEDRKYTAVHVCLAAIIAGGLGNMADRFRLDYVVDYISFVLINFPVFNAADCYIVVSTITIFLLFLFVYKDEDLEFLNFGKNKGSEKK